MEERLPRRLSWKISVALAWLLALAAGSAQGQTGASTSVGYIDGAIPRDQFRLRFDSASGNNRPERADFFYPTGALSPQFEPNVNYQEMNAYLEMAASPRLSGFVEMPYRWLEPAVNPNQKGFSDINFGVKWAALYQEDQVLTFQTRAYAPTGDGLLGLGRDHWCLEPALLYYRRLSEKLTFEAEFRDFIPVASSDDFAGNIIRYGVGFSYLAYDGPRFHVKPVAEVVGWTVLTGKDEPIEDAEISASGATIINAKFGLRIGFGDSSAPGLLGKSDLYIGYGQALTGAVWYKDMVRVEYRLSF
jgi:hypothetical protein